MPCVGFWLLSAFAGMAIALTTAGLYAVLVAALKRDSRNAAIRLACGATPWRLLIELLRRRLALFAGLLVGTALLPLTERALMQFSNNAPGTVTAATTAGCVVAAAFLAALAVAGRRVMTISPRQLLMQGE